MQRDWRAAPWALQRPDLALLCLDEGQRADDGGDDICRLGDIRWPDPVQSGSVDAADGGHLGEVLRPGRLGLRFRAEHEHEDRGDSRRQEAAGRGEEHTLMSRSSHHCVMRQKAPSVHSSRS